MSDNVENSIKGQIVTRHDSLKFHTLESARSLEHKYNLIAPHEYNTVEPVDDGYVVTNKFDPRCNDKVTPLTPGYSYYASRR